ncbi:MAG TPA: DUF1905 domain-containing protein [Sphingomicrobium sp.]|nr:DUF1905 domain-containing protein [Sphingomicrobium sp.]
MSSSTAISITAPLWLWSSENGRWHFVTVPEEQSDEIRAHCFAVQRGFRSARVSATIHSTGSGQAVTWRTSVFPMKSGGYILPVKAEVRRKADIAVDDQVTVTLELL